MRQRFYIAVADRFFLVSQRLEILEKLIGGFDAHENAQFAQPLDEGVPTRMLAQHHLAAAESYRLGRHDLICQRVRHHAVLVDTRLVREGIVAYN